ncbi:MAG TPA: rod shape-determining protein MreC [Acidimicrobiales bacterium]
MALSTRRSGRTRFTILLLVLTAVTLLTLDGRGFGPIDSARSAILSALSPVGDAASAVAEPIGNAWDSAFRQSDLQAENERLREDNDRLQGEVLAGQVAQQQLQQVLELVDLTFTGNIPVVRTQVVAGSVSNFGQTLDLDKGSSSGIAKDMAVVTGKGLIGKVVQVSENRSTIELITSGNYKVGVTALGTAAVGIVQGTGSPTVVQGTNFDVSQSQNLSVDQFVVTGGTSPGASSFPPGLPVGTITKVVTDAAARNTTVDIELLADTTNLTYADVVLYPALP